MSSVVFFAKSDGGAKVVEDYYQKAIDWDESKVAIDNYRQLSWEIDCDLIRHVEEGVILRCQKSGENLSVQNEPELMANLYRPDLSGSIALGALEYLGDGAYSGNVESLREGIWDVDLEFLIDGIKHKTTLRTELN